MLDLEFDAEETDFTSALLVDAFALQLGWHSSLQEEESYWYAAVPVH